MERPKLKSATGDADFQKNSKNPVSGLSTGCFRIDMRIPIKEEHIIGFLNNTRPVLPIKYSARFFFGKTFVVEKSRPKTRIRKKRTFCTNIRGTNEEAFPKTRRKRGMAK
jgi:hypothetical protein